MSAFYSFYRHCCQMCLPFCRMAQRNKIDSRQTAATYNIGYFYMYMYNPLVILFLRKLRRAVRCLPFNNGCIPKIIFKIKIYQSTVQHKQLFTLSIHYLRVNLPLRHFWKELSSNSGSFHYTALITASLCHSAVNRFPLQLSIF